MESDHFKADNRVIVQTVRQNYTLTRPIYIERANLIRSIPHFWAIVIEEAPEEIDRRIQPCDTAALSLLQAIEVTRFEISPDDPEIGEPRSVKFSFSFAENAWFEDRVLEKKFWYRRGKDGWTGLVSNPVPIHWKKGKDVTEGLLDHAVHIFNVAADIRSLESRTDDEDMGTAKHKQKLLNEKSTSYKTLVEKLIKTLKTTPQDAVSFFAWFGYRGRDVSAEESAEAIKLECEKREGFHTTKGTVPRDHSVMDTEDGQDAIPPKAVGLDEVDEHELSHEIFPAGEDLAIAISEDLYPGAIKYFSKPLQLTKTVVTSINEFAAQAQEKDVIDSDDEEDNQPDSDTNYQDSPSRDEPATKRLKTAA